MYIPAQTVINYIQTQNYLPVKCNGSKNESFIPFFKKCLNKQTNTHKVVPQS